MKLSSKKIFASFLLTLLSSPYAMSTQCLAPPQFCIPPSELIDLKETIKNQVQISNADIMPNTYAMPNAESSIVQKQFDNTELLIKKTVYSKVVVLEIAEPL